MEELTLIIYDIRVTVTAPERTAAALRKDFAYFCKPAAPRRSSIEIHASADKPPSGTIPKPLFAGSFLNLRFYDRGGKRYVNYLGRALAIYDYAAERGDVYSEDPNLLHEIVYLMIHSRVGELLDRRSIHRIHACGLTINGRGAVILLPQGGGKTTLCLELLKKSGVRLLSDDTPFVTLDSMLLPCPLRIGVNKNDALDVPPEHVSIFVRRKYGDKKLIGIEYFRERIADAAPLDTLFVGRRVDTPESHIDRMNAAAAFPALVKNCVIGIGLPQMIEYFVRFEFRDLVRKSGIALSRTQATLAILRKARLYSFTMGSDTRKNAEVLMDFMGGKAS